MAARRFVSSTGPTPTSAVVFATAKVNLFLRVLGRLGDGYHDLESLIVPIDLADRLEIHAASDPAGFRTLSLSLEVTGEPGLVAGVPADESNLVLRAASALAERARVRGFAEIVLEKKIPSSAGLGGGSADAAATLKALNGLWSCGLDDGELLRVAAAVGSDVPALLAETPVFVRGRGERVSPVRIGGLKLALATFDFGVSTAQAFGWWDEDGRSPGPDPAEILREGDLRVMGERQGDPGRFAKLLYNDLEQPVVDRHPVIREVEWRLRAAGVDAALMSGSGPSVVAILPRGIDRFDPSVERDVDRASGRPLRYVTSEPLPWGGE